MVCCGLLLMVNQSKAGFKYIMDMGKLSHLMQRLTDYTTVSLINSLIRYTGSHHN